MTIVNDEPGAPTPVPAPPVASDAPAPAPTSPASVPAAIRCRGLSKAFGTARNAVVALDRVDLDVRAGEFVCVVGASGCGKSTLLNLVAGLDAPTRGQVDVVGRTALMFQDSALFPWLTVADNVGLPLRLAGMPKGARQARVEELLASVHLAGQGERRPHELSGGMRQRVALARALAQEAEILLMDEPFGALDAMTRDLLHDELERLWVERSLTILFVTHNVREASRLGDRIALLTSRPGRVAATFDVPFARPRRIEAPEVSEMAGLVTARLRQEVARHGPR
ncbi:MAG: sulfonate transport system ATP-binding protein [Acidimicrobiaceae bacterium]|nr:sulfonate transport system ATP-binding protein [Acidimicrobiaceae bacterium]MDQ1443759.1 sulfonate transport system ATP-binding protein [Acidimicrobiaceae bacterium]